MGKCVVVAPDSAYTNAYEAKLRGLLEEGIDLFCAAGPHATSWEDAMDWLCVQLDVDGVLPGAFCNTTSHSDQSVEEVLEFARNWNRLKGEEPDVRVLEI